MQNHTPDKPAAITCTLQPEHFDAIRDLLANYSGIFLDRTSQRVLTLGVSQRLGATGLTLGAYLARLAGANGAQELQHLAELIANHETIFFRNMPHMKALQDVILPQLHRTKGPNAPIRIWSAGCSTGEEPYSLAMTALESLGNPLPRPVHILATDLSDTALARARRGVYRGRTLTNVSTEVRLRYFEHRQEGWAVGKKVRDMVTFERLNLLQPFPGHLFGVDVIFCQNVTIYFQLSTFRNLVERFYNMLPEGGLLFLGFSETLWNVFDKFRLLEMMGAFVYVKDTQARKAPPVAAAASPPVVPRVPPVTPRSGDTTGSAARLRAARTRHQQRPADQQDATLPLRLPRDASQPASTAYTNESDAIQRGSDLLHEGRADEALALLYKLPLNGPHAPQVLALIARAHANRGDFDLAVAEARRALELDTLTVEAYLLLGMLYAQQGQPRESVQQFERARYLEPDSALISYHLADSYRQLERGALALREYRNALRKLTGYAPDSLLDGVAVGWLQETCERHIKLLAETYR